MCISIIDKKLQDKKSSLPYFVDSPRDISIIHHFVSITGEKFSPCHLYENQNPSLLREDVKVFVSDSFSIYNGHTYETIRDNKKYNNLIEFDRVIVFKIDKDYRCMIVKQDDEFSYQTIYNTYVYDFDKIDCIVCGGFRETLKEAIEKAFINFRNIKKCGCGDYIYNEDRDINQCMSCVINNISDTISHKFKWHSTSQVILLI